MTPSRAAGAAAGAGNRGSGPQPETAYAWMRLIAAFVLSTIGGVGMWSVVVALPPIQAEFGVARSAASLPYTFTMVGFALSGILMGKLSDRFGIIVPVIVGASALGLGFVTASHATSLWQFALIQGLIGVGSSATFAPLLADTSLWFTRRRGIAVAIFASGNYFAGTLWPPVMQHFIQGVGWRQTYLGIGLFCVVSMLPLALGALRRKPPVIELTPAGSTAASWSPRPFGLSPGALQALLVVAGLCCCIAMSMPQVHIVAYCGDLGYGAARGAQMLSLMLGFGIVSRLASGWICDRIGGLRTLLLGSGAAGAGAGVLPAVRRARLAVRDFRVVRPVPRWHRARLRHHRARVLFTEGSRSARGHGDHGDHIRHGTRRLDVRRDLRPDRLLSRRVSQRHRVEPGEHLYRRMAAGEAEAEARRGVDQLGYR